MSWHATTTIPKGTDYKEAYDQIHAMTPVGNDDAAEERDEAMNWGKDAALELLEGDVVGSGDKSAIKIEISGHSNPKHEKREGSAPDRLSIVLEQVPE